MSEVQMGATEYFLAREHVVQVVLTCTADQKPNMWELKELIRKLLQPSGTTQPTVLILDIQTHDPSLREVRMDVYVRTRADAEGFAARLNGQTVKMAGLRVPYQASCAVRTERHPVIDEDTIEWRHSLFQNHVSQSTFEQEFRYLEPGNRPDTLSVIGWPASLVVPKGKFNEVILTRMFAQFGPVKKIDFEYKDVVDKEKTQQKTMQIELLIQYDDFGSFINAVRSLNQRVLRKRNAPAIVRYEYSFKCFGRMTDESIKVRKIGREKKEEEESRRREEERIAEELRKKMEIEEAERKLREQREAEERQRAAAEEERKRKEKEEELNRKLKLELEMKRKEMEKKKLEEIEAKKKIEQEKKKKEEEERIEREKKEQRRKRKEENRRQKQEKKKIRKARRKIEKMEQEREFLIQAIKREEQMTKEFERQWDELKQLTDTEDRYWPPMCDRNIVLVNYENNPIDLIFTFIKTPQQPRIMTDVKGRYLPSVINPKV